VLVGVFWDVRRWLLVVVVFYGITLPLFTTEFTNIRGGVTSDSVGRARLLDRAEQDVRRGEQPFFYYAMMLPAVRNARLLPALIGGAILVWRGHGLGCCWRGGPSARCSL
jgi:hypothetical protein